MPYSGSTHVVIVKCAMTLLDENADSDPKDYVLPLYTTKEQGPKLLHSVTMVNSYGGKIWVFGGLYGQGFRILIS